MSSSAITLMREITLLGHLAAGRLRDQVEHAVDCGTLMTMPWASFSRWMSEAPALSAS